MGQIQSIRMSPESIPIAKCVIHQGLVYVSGQVGFKPGTTQIVEGGIKEQARATFQNITNILKEAGSSVDRILFVHVYLPNVQRDFAAMNEVFREWVGDHRPARTTVGADLAIKELFIEVDCVAAVG